MPALSIITREEKVNSYIATIFIMSYYILASCSLSDISNPDADERLKNQFEDEAGNPENDNKDNGEDNPDDAAPETTIPADDKGDKVNTGVPDLGNENFYVSDGKGKVIDLNNPEDRKLASVLHCNQDGDKKRIVYQESRNDFDTVKVLDPTYYNLNVDSGILSTSLQLFETQRGAKIRCISEDIDSAEESEKIVNIGSLYIGLNSTIPREVMEQLFNTVSQQYTDLENK